MKFLKLISTMKCEENLTKLYFHINYGKCLTRITKAAS